MSLVVRPDLDQRDPSAADVLVRAFQERIEELAALQETAARLENWAQYGVDGGWRDAYTSALELIEAALPRIEQEARERLLAEIETEEELLA